MKEYLRPKKTIVIFILSIFLSLGIGVSMAQSEVLPTEITPSVFSEDEINKADVVQFTEEELQKIEESIQETENILSETKPASVDEIKIQNVREVNNIKKINKSFQIQSDELLKILEEKDVTRIEGIKRKKLEDTRIFLENATMEDGVIEEDTANDISKDSDIDIDKKETLDEGIKDTILGQTTKEESDILEKKKKIINRIEAKKEPEDTLKDSDNDGISDYDEIYIYETDPFSADSDNDGYIDGTEVLRGFDPKNSSLNAIVVYENPQKSGDTEEGLFAISKIEIIDEDITAGIQNIETSESSGKVLFEGKSLPNSFITLYIFSIPTVVTVKTDEDGNWNYVMDTELENGDHEIYVAMTDNSGKILAKSKPMPFVKEAFAVTVDKNLLSIQLDGSKPSFFNLGYLYITMLILIFLIGIVLTVIGVKVNFRKEEMEDII